ncbi:MAG TPA: metalloregulator ArsR/SmtB family transcription factor [Gemmatimonadaceae bacterium]|nr:metalloregulator ArsR/SmtB family transcription factor [Gemmatimonadaceae bacterium]
MNRATRLDLAFRALADPTRRRIVERLARGDHPVMELAREFSITQPAVTKHLDALENAGIIGRRRTGRQRICYLRPTALESSIEWIARCRRFWNQRFDALDALLAEDTREED